MSRRDIEPETRVGNCCGCHQLAMLFKVPGIFRYRCDACFEKETGQRHFLASAISALSLPGYERPREWIDEAAWRGFTEVGE